MTDRTAASLPDPAPQGAPGAAPTAHVDTGPNAFLRAWLQLFKTGRIHTFENAAMKRPVQTFLDVTNRIVSQEGRISFQTKDRACFMNMLKLRISSEEYQRVLEVCSFFEERGMGGFAVEGALDENQVRQIVDIVVRCRDDERQFDVLKANLAAAGLPFAINKPLSVARRTDTKVKEVHLSRRAYTFYTYAKLVVLYRSLLAEAQASQFRRQFLMKKIARTIQALVDVCMEDDHTYLGVQSIKSADDYPAHHGANVAVLSIALGDKLGLEKVELFELGMAALFADLGLARLPADLLARKGVYDEDERRQIETHPLLSVDFLLDEGSSTRAQAAGLVVAFEHHFRGDKKGYPAVSHAADLYARIVGIADTFDALTTYRPWRQPYLPDEALTLMLKEAGKSVDPILMKVFINMLGLYPAGTLVRLSSEDLAVVVFGGGDDRTVRPVVAPVGADGKPTGTVDLLDKNAAGAYERSILYSESPARYGIRPSGVLANL